MGKSTGVLSTVYLSHATPAAFTAHAKSRNDVEDLAKEMLNDSTLDVLIGAGHPWFDDNGKQVGGLGGNPYKTEGAYRPDRWRGALARCPRKQGGQRCQWRWHARSLEAGRRPGRLHRPGERWRGGRPILGVLPVAATLQANRDGDKNAGPLRSSPYTESAGYDHDCAGRTQRSRRPEGFFLMAEGGAIDWAAHENAFGRLIEEQHDFDLAIEAVAAWVEKNSSWDDTLLIITADHETGYLCGPNSVGNETPGKQGQGRRTGVQLAHGEPHQSARTPLCQGKRRGKAA